MHVGWMWRFFMFQHLRVIFLHRKYYLSKFALRWKQRLRNKRKRKDKKLMTVKTNDVVSKAEHLCWTLYNKLLVLLVLCLFSSFSCRSWLNCTLSHHYLGVNGGVVHGRGIESLTLCGCQWWCSAWSCVRIFDFVGVSGDVVHVVGSNICLFGGHQWCSAWSWVRIFVMFVFSGVINAWSWVRFFCLLGVSGGVVHGRGFESLTFWGSLVV
jgi:hypothetical protein